VLDLKFPMYVNECSRMKPKESNWWHRKNLDQGKVVALSEDVVADLACDIDNAKFVFQQVSEGLKETETSRLAVDTKAIPLLASSTAAASALMIFAVKEASTGHPSLVFSVGASVFFFVLAIAFSIAALWPRSYKTAGTKAQDWLSNHPSSLDNATLVKTILRWSIRYETRRQINLRSNQSKEHCLSKSMACFGLAPLFGAITFALAPLWDRFI
jgi:hypothetical protein